MKTYLQRLAERAEGLSATHLLRPAMRPEIFPAVGSDSESVRDERLLPVDAETRTPSFLAEGEPTVDEREHIQRVEMPAAPGREPRVEAPVTVGFNRSESSELAEPRPEHASVVQPRVEGDETAIAQHLAPNAETMPPRRSIVEMRYSERDQHQPFEVQPDSPQARTSPRLSPVQYVDEPFTTLRASSANQGRQSNQPYSDVPHGPLSPVHHIERLVPTAKDVDAAVMIGAPIPSLDLTRAGPIRQVESNSGGPRLVIGQLTVDILPSGPGETRAVVRGTQRRIGVREPGRGSPVSQLRFGLRQM